MSGFYILHKINLTFDANKYILYTESEDNIMLIFSIIIFIWGLLGICGLINCKKERIIWELLIFGIMMPFLPVFAKLCGLI